VDRAATLRQYFARSKAITAYKLFEGRSHYTCGEKGWEEVADFALDWTLAPAAGDLGKA
jgi:hypothetical protein